MEVMSDVVCTVTGNIPIESTGYTISRRRSVRLCLTVSVLCRLLKTESVLVNLLAIVSEAVACCMSCTN